ncbi:MAG: histidine kinase dimerization/phospho-acceptor domain-containing protein, partial [Candidatus Margulisbacteria bacterium]|nr:histidine kinase dimerization/phospho-acceptor domain-containing protein [Candidatus Margulisiibacteriota bacterium]
MTINITAGENESQLLVQDIKDKFLWSIWIRYLVAVMGFFLFLSSSFNHVGLKGAEYGLVLAGLVVLYNIVSHLIYLANKQIKLWQLVLLRSCFQVFDIFCVTFLIYITGWLESPYWFLYLVLIILSGFGVFSIYSALPVFMIAIFSSVFYLGLLILTYLGILPVYGVTFSMSAQQLLQSILNKAVFTTITFFLFASTIYYFSKLLSQQREELLRKNQLLLAALDELKEVDRVKDEFVSTASHELRTPLAVIRENASLIGDGVAGDVNDRQKKLVASSLSNVDRLAKILDSLLDISKIESRSIELKLQPADIGRLALKAIDLIKELANNKKISIESKLSAGVISWVDADQILRVFINLIDNAVKYTPENGNIIVTVSILGNQVISSVEDNGIGIAEPDLPMLFERFVR